MRVGRVIRDIRMSKNISSNKVYKNILSKPAIEKFEQGLSDTSVEKFFAILDALNITLEEFEVMYKKGGNKDYTPKYIETNRSVELGHSGFSKLNKSDSGVIDDIADLDKIQSQISELLVSSDLLIDNSFREKIIIYQKYKPYYYPFGHLCILHFKAFSSNQSDEIYKIAAAIELIILALDIVDDLQDKDVDTPWTKETDISLNAVLALIIFSLRVIRKSQFQHASLALEILERNILNSINGQYQDLTINSFSEESYLKMIELKSGGLTTLSVNIGYCLATGVYKTTIEEYATYIGIIQQINNDINDLKLIGKKNDLINKKFSLPILYLMNLKDEISIKIIEYYHQDNLSLDEDLLSSIPDYLIEKGAITYAVALRNIYKIKAINFIESLNINHEMKSKLKKLLE